MSKIRDELKNSAVKFVVDNKVVEQIKSEVKKFDVFINILGQFKIIGVDLSDIEKDLKIMKDATNSMLLKLSKLQDEVKEKTKKVENVKDE